MFVDFAFLTLSQFRGSGGRAPGAKMEEGGWVTFVTKNGEGFYKAMASIIVLSESDLIGMSENIGIGFFHTRTISPTRIVAF